ncbi:DUF5050 domain-containing protein [Psychrobacillus sp. FSL H8-0483]|uniref:DUF5050 domain-containing protein n=1 Tax=Psychrobacillus sp. FSL H8-0483 TaxID=2921389 RepID=UPI00315B299F
MSFKKKRILGWIALMSMLLLPSQSLAAGKAIYVPLSYENGAAPGIYQVVPNTKKATLIIKDNTHKLVEIEKPVVELNVNGDNKHYKLGEVTTSKQVLEEHYPDYTQFSDPIEIGKELLFQKYLGETTHEGGCGGAVSAFTLLYKKAANGKDTLLTKDTIANATGDAVQVKENTIYYTKVNKDFLENYTLYKMDADGNNKVEIAKSIDDYILSDTNEIYYLKDNKFYKMDLNGKKSTHLTSIKDHIHGELPCDGPNYKFTDSGIYFHADFQTSVYDFATGKTIVGKENSFYNIVDHSKKLDQFAVLDYDSETGATIGNSITIIDKNGTTIKNIKLSADAKKVKVDINTGIVSYFVKTAFFEEKY